MAIFGRAIIEQAVRIRLDNTKDYVFGEYLAPAEYQRVTNKISKQIQETGTFTSETGETLNIDSLAAGPVLNLLLQKFDTQYSLMSQLPKAGNKNDTKLFTLL